MAVAEIIGSAIGTMILIVVAYLLVGNVLTAAGVVSSAQKDMTLLSEAQLRTSINVTEPPQVVGNIMTFSVANNGEEIISDLPHMDVFSFDATNGYVHYTYSTSGIINTWEPVQFNNDIVHANELDPGVTMMIQVDLPDNVAKVANTTPINIQVTTSNGVSAYSALIPGT